MYVYKNKVFLNCFNGLFFVVSVRFIIIIVRQTFEELDGPAVNAIVEAKQRWSVIVWVTKN
jgi:hypothetical protein